MLQFFPDDSCDPELDTVFLGLEISEWFTTSCSGRRYGQDVWPIVHLDCLDGTFGFFCGCGVAWVV